MIGNLIKLVLFLVVGILVYNFFLGTESEKEASRKIFQEVKDVAVSVKDLVKEEKDKFDEGKYDDALRKIGNVFRNLRTKAENYDSRYLKKIDSLEERRQELEERLSELEKERKERPEDYNRRSEKERQKINRDLEKLMEEMEEVNQEMENSVKDK